MEARRICVAVGYAIESDDPRLRYPVGPDALAFLGWRATLSDEGWVGLGGLSKGDYAERLRAGRAGPPRSCGRSGSWRSGAPFQ